MAKREPVPEAELVEERGDLDPVRSVVIDRDGQSRAMSAQNLLGATESAQLRALDIQLDEVDAIQSKRGRGVVERPRHDAVVVLRESDVRCRTSALDREARVRAVPQRSSLDLDA